MLGPTDRPEQRDHIRRQQRIITIGGAQGDARRFVLTRATNDITARRVGSIDRGEYASHAVKNG